MVDTKLFASKNYSGRIHQMTSEPIKEHEKISSLIFQQASGPLVENTRSAEAV
jgi:hypothetical protein